MLYRAKQFDALTDLLPLAQSSPLCAYTGSWLATTLSHICQAFGECGQLKQMQLFANHSYFCFMLTERHDNSALIRKYIQEDFHINIG
jgi:hypothetical protein